GSAVGGEERGQDRDGRRLPRAVRPEQAHDHSGLGGEVDAVQRDNASVALSQARRLDRQFPRHRSHATQRAPSAVRRTGGESGAMALDKETEERIEQPVSEQAEKETRLAPAQAVDQMRIRAPVRANRKLRTLFERVNVDKRLKGWWHVANVNATVRMEINDHSWVHIQIVTNIALKLLRQLTKHHVEPSVVRDFN